MKGDQATAAGDALAHHVEFALPCPELRPYLVGFHSYEIRCDPADRFEEIFFPAWVNIRFALSGEPWAMRIGTTRFDPIPDASLFGPTGQAGFADFSRGRMIGVGIGPRGWARLFGGDVSVFTDRILPLEAILGETAAALHDRMRAAVDFGARVEIFQGFLLERLAQRGEEPAEIAAVQALLSDPAFEDIEDFTSRTAMPRWRLARLCRRSFGFPPKRLIRRARFMRTLMALREQPDRRWPELLDGYADQSHFIRDCRDFVGMAPGQFLARAQPVAITSMAERTRVLGAPAQVLHRDSPCDESAAERAGLSGSMPRSNRG